MVRAVAFIVLLCTFLPERAVAQCHEVEADPSPRPLFLRRDAYVAGGFAAATVLFSPYDQYIAEYLQDSTLQNIDVLEVGATAFKLLGFPGPVLIGPAVYGLGRLSGSDCLADFGLHVVEAVLLGVTLNQAVKTVAGRARPRLNRGDPLNFKLGRGLWNGDYQSFPSGHSVSAFATASSITAEVARIQPELKIYVGVVMYGGAALVGVSRMYNNQHWLSDVLIGAALGTFSGVKMVLYNHRRPNNRLNRLLLSFSVLPDGAGGAVPGLRITMGRSAAGHGR